MRWLLFSGCFLFSIVNVQGSTIPDSTDMLKLNRVIIIGNKKTLDRIILRELSLRPGDSIMRYALDKVLIRDKNKIYNLRIFHTVKPRMLELPDNSFDLLIEVEERWYTFPVPIFELSDRNFNEWWQNYDHELNRINFGLRLYQYNFRGRNETIRLTAQFGFSRKFDLTYRIPYIDKKQKHGLTLDANFSEPKNLSYRTENHKLVFLRGRETLRNKFGVGVTYTYRKSFYETHNLSFDFDTGNIADTIQSLNDNYYLHGSTSQWYTSMSYSFISEHRDVIAYPLHGYQIIAGIRKIGLGFGESVNLTVITTSAAFHKDLGKKFYFSNFTTGYWSNPTRQPYALFYGQGYKRTFVRGYEIYVIEGPVWALNKTTIKRKIFQHTYRLLAMPWEKFQHFPLSIYLKAYADFGYTKNYPYYEEKPTPWNTLYTNKLIAGTGIGLDFVTAYDGVLRVEYTLNRQGAHGFFFHIKKEF
jgi:outer membrane protein assembly factor BamA